MEHLYRLHTGFVVLFLIFALLFVVAHLWKRES
jgi:hypothetical protein